MHRSPARFARCSFFVAVVSALLFSAEVARSAQSKNAVQASKAPTEKTETSGDPDLIAAVKGVQVAPTPKGPFLPSSETLINPSALAGHKTGTLVLLHTNDIHDILIAPSKGLGGLAYVAGYVNSVRTQRPDTLFVDAGDIQEKGDNMGVTSHGEASYLALGSIGLDATVPGNHDFAYGLPKLIANTQLAHLPMLCAGMIYQDTKESVFPESMIKQIGTLRVGLIGATIARSANSERPVQQFEIEALGKRVNELARAMEDQVDLTVLVIHNGTWASKVLAQAAPMIDVVVCGHTNEITEKPLKAESGALIVTVGRAGQWVGTLDLVVDRDQKKVARYSYVLVPMDHEKVKPDAKVAGLISELDRKWSHATP